MIKLCKIFQSDKDILKKLSSDTAFNTAGLCFPYIIGSKKDSFSPLSFSIGQNVQAIAIRKKSTHNWKEKIKTQLYLQITWLFLKKILAYLQKQLTELSSEFRKFICYKVNTQKSTVYLDTNCKQFENTT